MEDECLKWDTLWDLANVHVDAIQSYDIDEHIIIEINSDVIVNLKKWAAKQKHKVTAMEGLWKDQIALVEDNSLDGVLYDAYPLKEAEKH